MKRTSYRSQEAVRFDSYPILGNRGGFTLVELMLALVLGMVILAGAYILMETTAKQQRLLRGATELNQEAQQVDLALRRDMERAGRSMISSWNAGGVNVITSGSEESPEDQLILLWGNGPSHRSSAQECDNFADPCVSLLGDHASQYSTGDLILVGNQATGIRIGQVTQVSSSYSRECGPDCLEALSCPDAFEGDISGIVVTGSTTYPPSGSPTSSSEPCEQPFYPDGTYCEESTASQNLGTVTTHSCSAAGTGNAAYTDIQYTDRTEAPFGFAPPALFTNLSGAAGYPEVRVQAVGLARYRIAAAPAGGEPSLMKTTALTSGGAWGEELPVARSVHNLLVETRQADETTWVRGTDLTNTDLVFNTSNSNLVREASPPSTAEALTPHYFIRSFRSIAALRATYVMTSWDEENEPRTRTRTTAVSLPNILGGGTYPTPQ